jgi:dTMP kinase
VKVELTREPTRDGNAGILLKRELGSVERAPDARYLQLLFVADRAWHVANFIAPKASDGSVIITDRYVDSTRAYGAASGLEMRWLTQINSRFPKADMTFILDITPEEASKRLAARSDKREIFDNMKMFRKLRSAYFRISKGRDGYHVIDANRSQDAVHGEIAAITDAVLQRK